MIVPAAVVRSYTRFQAAVLEHLGRVFSDWHPSGHVGGHARLCQGGAEIGRGHKRYGAGQGIELPYVGD